MIAGERFKTYIDSLAVAWKDRLGGWAMGVAAAGITKSLEDMEPGIIDQVRETMQKVIDNPATPPETKRLLEMSLSQGNIFHVGMGWILSVIGLIPALFGLGGPIGNVFNHMQELAMRSAILDPMMAITAWRRDPKTYEKYLEDLRLAGFDEDRIEALKFVTQVMPTPRDIVGFLAHEVFEPDMISKYSLLSEWEKIDKEYAKKIGVMEDELKLYWMDHWNHPEWGTIQELRHRDQITDQDVQDWFRLVEIPEYWRPKMLETMWGLPNRIEIRMMARYLDMSKEDIMALLKKAGLHEDYRADAADFMMIMGLTGYWADMLSKGWMTAEEVKEDIDARGFKPVTAERLYKRLVKASQPEKMAKERDLTMSQIVKGVKKAVISRSEGASLLQDMGYNPYESEFILAIEIPQDEVITEVKIRELTKSDILSGLKTGIITEEAALSKLLDLRYLPDDARFILSIYQATVTPPAEPRQREASKADIVKAVKTGLITPEEAYLMLQDIGFTPEASQFILMVQAESSPFSPMSYNEFKDLTQKYRIVAGREAKPMSEELKAAAAEVVKLTKDIEALQAAIKDEERTLVAEEILPEAATAKRDELRVALHRAEAALAAASSNYDKLLAEWRHKEG